MAVQNFGSGGGGFQISPGVNVSEIDLTTVVPPVATTVGAIAGVFRWGPLDQRVLVTSENDLVAKFGKPASINPETFFTAANFLAYSNALFVSRAGNTAVMFAAIANSSAYSADATHTIKNVDDYEAKVGSFDSDVQYIARCPGALGNSLKVSVCDTAEQFQSSVNLRNAESNTLFDDANTKITLAVGSNVATVTLANTTTLDDNTPLPHATAVAGLFNVGDFIEVGNTSIGRQAIKITEISSIVVGNTTGTNTGTATFTLSLAQPLKLSTAIDANTVARYWEYFNQVDTAPGQSEFVALNGNPAANDELHIVVVDEDGGFTGSPGSVLEVYKSLSRATDAKLSDGGTNYYKNVVNERSNYIWWASDRANAPSANAASITSSTNDTPLTLSFQGGVDGDETTTPFADIARAYDLFASPEEVDIALVLSGKARGGTHGEQLPNYLIDNIAEVRKDCVVFVSPAYGDVVNQNLNAADNVVEFRNAVRSSSFAVMDSGYKYQYDKYNDVYRYVPLNGDIAGLCVVTDNTRDPWFSPAGTSRGLVRNVVKLAFNPSRAQRDLLYKNGVNPVITQAGQGTLLFGDKTLLAKPSAFDRINVRRLFIVLEKAVSTAAKSFLFEFNDEFARTQFINLVEPYLRDVQGRRGITDFKVVCDETNNTPEVIDSNRFVGDIYVKPARSINFIQLNFVAVRSGIEFSEIVG
jgi:hypothetical protein